VAVGILPRLQLEATGAIDQGNQQAGTNFTTAINSGPNWSLGGGLRTAIPLGGDFDTQIAALYDRIDTTHVTNFCSTTEQSWHLSRETAEVGIAGKVDDVLALGFWLDGMLDEITLDSLAGPGNVVELGGRFGLQLHPWPESLGWLSFVLNLASGFPVATVSGAASGPNPWINLGLGATLTP
jgi:hypothetical protein